MSKRLRILLVEDDDDDYILTRSVIDRMTTDAVVEVQRAESYADALQAAFWGNHEVCLLDYRLGAKDGIELLRELRRRGYRTPVIILTGQGAYHVDVEAARAGASDYLVKGEITPALLERSIRYAIEQKRTERDLSLLAALVESSDDAIITEDLNGTILSWNAAAERLYGYSADEIVGQPISLLFPPEVKGELNEILGAIRKGWAVIREEALRMRKDGTRVRVSLSISPLRETGGRVIGASIIAREISQVQGLREQLARAEKIVEVGKLGGGMAYDLSRLVTVIRQGAAALSRSLGSDLPEQETVDEIRRASERAANLVADLLAVSREKLVETGTLELNALVEETELLVRDSIPDRISLRMVLDSAAGEVTVNGAEFQHALRTLIITARDGIPGEGAIVLSTGQQRVPEAGPDEAPQIPPGTYASVVIRGSGGGPGPERAEAAVEIVAAAAELLSESGGHLLDESDAGCGTAFTVLLPRPSTESPEKAPPSPPEPPQTPRSWWGKAPRPL